jgi:O-antigen/teichoic acid export membrane protein
VTAPARPGETLDERDDRNLTDLLQELRVAGIGVQVLFGFLLGLPFTTRFDRLEDWQRWLYLSILLLAAASIVLLVAPVAYHRLVFRRHQREHLIRAANIMAICGLATVSLSVSAAVLLVISYVEPGPAAVLAAAVTAAMFGSLWFLLPLARRQQAPGPAAESAAGPLPLPGPVPAAGRRQR